MPEAPSHQHHPKVLLVGPGMTGGGAEGRFARIAKHLFAGAADAAGLHAGGAVVPGSPFDLEWRGRGSYVRVIRRVRRLLVEHDYDAAMTFGLFPSATTLLARMTTRRRIKVIVNEISRPEPEAKTSGRLRGFIYTQLRRRLYPQADKLTANSIDGLRETCRITRIPLARGARTHNAIDAEAVRCRAAEPCAMKPPAKPYLATLCRLDFMKRTETAIHALHRLGDSCDLDLLIIGDGLARPTLETLVQKLDLRSRVTFTGQVRNPLPLLRQARALLVTSEHEGFSNTLLEAMCLDVPVITSLCSSDMREICEQGAALGFDVGDARTLASQIAKLTGDVALRGNIAANASRYIEPHLLHNAIREYEQVITATINA